MPIYVSKAKFNVPLAQRYYRIRNVYVKLIICLILFYINNLRNWIMAVAAALEYPSTTLSRHSR